MTLNKRLKLAILPLDIKQAEPTENFTRLTEALTDIDKDTDLLLLPELFTTGFVAEPEAAVAVAEPYDDSTDSTLLRLKEIARKHRMAVCGSYLKLNSEGRPANCCMFVEPSGETARYCKHHLFGISRESEIYAAGTKEPPIIRYRGWNISMVVCYDLRFPAWCRNRGLRYDLLLLPANWPVSRSYAWQHLLIARAIENQAAVAGADRSGSDTFGDYDGLSEVYDWAGRGISTPGKGGFLYATLLKDKLEEYRRRFPFYNDADKFGFD